MTNHSTDLHQALDKKHLWGKPSLYKNALLGCGLRKEIGTWGQVVLVLFTLERVSLIYISINIISSPGEVPAASAGPGWTASGVNQERAWCVLCAWGWRVHLKGRSLWDSVVWWGDLSGSRPWWCGWRCPPQDPQDPSFWAPANLKQKYKPRNEHHGHRRWDTCIYTYIYCLSHSDQQCTWIKGHPSNL